MSDAVKISEGSLNEVLHHPWMGWVSSDTPIDLSLWVLSGNTPGFLGIVYGRIIRTSQTPTGAWIHRDLGSFDTAAGTFHFGALHNKCRAEQARKAVLALVQNKTLGEACEAAGLSKPEKYANSADSSRWDLGPIQFFPTADDAGFGQAGRAKIATSPHSHAPCWSAQLFSVDRLALDGRSEELPSDVALRVLDSLFPLLTGETGLRLDANDAPRLKTIEWLSFPSCDGNLQPLVDISFRKGKLADTEDVHVTIRQMAGTSSLLVVLHREAPFVKLRAISKTVKLDAPSEVVVFSAQPALGFVRCEIFKQVRDDGDWELWFSHSLAPVRQVNVGISVIGSTIQVRSDWLERLSRSRLGSARAQKLMKVQKISHEQELLIGEPDTAWEISARQAKETAEVLRERTAKSEFFEKGWDSPSPNTGLLSFAVWLKATIEKKRVGKWLLIDPYFDMAGLGLLATINTNDIALAVLTSTQIKSDDDCVDTTKTKSTRADRLREQCDHLEVVLSPLRFTIYDVSSTKVSRPLHDRYFLYYAEGELPTDGFQLSNSIQGATRNHPLLITPIEGKALELVGAYVHRLLNGNDGRLDVHPLWQPKPIQDLRPADKKLLLERLWPFTQALFSVEDEAYNAQAMRNLGILAEDGEHGKVPSEIEEAIPRFVKALQEATQVECARLWVSYLYWSRNTVSSEMVDELMAQRIDSALAAKLAATVPVIAMEVTPMGVSKRAAFNRSALLSSPFSEAVKEIARHVEHVEYAGAGGVGQTAEILAQAFSPSIDAALDAVSAYEFPVRSEEVRSNAKDAILNGLTRLASANSLPFTAAIGLLESRYAALRALGFHDVTIRLLTKAISEQEYSAILDKMAPEEAVWGLAECVGDLRVEANRKGTDNSDLEKLRAFLFQQIRRLWSATGGKVQLRDLIKRVGGPLEGSWIVSTYNELLLAMVHDGLVAADVVVSTIGGMLLDRLKQTDAHYYGPAHDGLTQLVAHFLALETDDAIRPTWEGVMRVARNAVRITTKPFSESIDYSQWADAKSRLQWVAALLFCTISLFPGESEHLERQDAIRAKAAEIDRELELLEHPFGRHYETDLTRFFKFAKSRVSSAAD